MSTFSLGEETKLIMKLSILFFLVVTLMSSYTKTTAEISRKVLKAKDCLHDYENRKCSSANFEADPQCVGSLECWDSNYTSSM